MTAWWQMKSGKRRDAAKANAPNNFLVICEHGTVTEYVCPATGIHYFKGSRGGYHRFPLTSEADRRVALICAHGGMRSLARRFRFRLTEDGRIEARNTKQRSYRLLVDPETSDQLLSVLGQLGERAILERKRAGL